jgi:PHD/YefM family antitoxin component YafN of YafNO toxin-antitoxin module
MAQILTITKAKQQLLNLARRNEQLGESFIILRDGEPVSALLPFSEYESLLETLDILESEPDILLKLKRSAKEVRRGAFTIWKGSEGRMAKKKGR